MSCEKNSLKKINQNVVPWLFFFQPYCLYMLYTQIYNTVSYDVVNTLKQS